MRYTQGDKVRILWPARLKGKLGTIDKVVLKAGGFYCVEMDDTKEYLIGHTDKELELP